jgi:hypothetical protein
MNQRACARNWSWPDLRYCPRICLRHWGVLWLIWSPGQDLILRPPKYEARAISTSPWHSVIYCIQYWHGQYQQTQFLYIILHFIPSVTLFSPFMVMIQISGPRYVSWLGMQQALLRQILREEDLTSFIYISRILVFLLIIPKTFRSATELAVFSIYLTVLHSKK